MRTIVASLAQSACATPGRKAADEQGYKMLSVKFKMAQTKWRQRECTGNVEAAAGDRFEGRGRSRDRLAASGGMGRPGRSAHSVPHTAGVAKRGAVSEPALGWQRGPDQGCTAGQTCGRQAAERASGQACASHAARFGSASQTDVVPAAAKRNNPAPHSSAASQQARHSPVLAPPALTAMIQLQGRAGALGGTVSRCSRTAVSTALRPA